MLRARTFVEINTVLQTTNILRYLQMLW